MHLFKRSLILNDRGKRGRLRSYWERMNPDCQELETSSIFASLLHWITPKRWCLLLQKLSLSTCTAEFTAINSNLGCTETVLSGARYAVAWRKPQFLLPLPYVDMTQFRWHLEEAWKEWCYFILTHNDRSTVSGKRQRRISTFQS